MDFNGDLNLATLQPAPVFPELYEELWWYSGALASTTSTVHAYAQKGSTSLTANNTISQANVYTHNWPSTTQCAFEITLESFYSADVVYAQICDITANSMVSSSLITLTNNAGTPTVVRSGNFTLTQGHSYAVTVWTNTSSNTAYFTDASLIVFPSSPLTSPSVSAISLANPSGNTLKEAYYPMWVYSSGTATNSSSLTGNVYLIQKGSTSSVIYSSATSSAKLFTLSSTWSPSQKFVLETSTYSASGTNVSAVSELYDFNTSSLVSASQISLSYTTTATLLRSGTFTLTPGHTYGVALGPSTSGNSVYLTKAHLVALAN